MWESIVHILSSTMERILKEGELEQRVKTRTMELEETLEALKRSQQADSAIIKRIAHGLRAPLNSIMGLSQLIAEGGQELPIEIQGAHKKLDQAT